MKTIVSKLATKAAINNSHDEVMHLVKLAQDSISSYDVASKMVFDMLGSTPTINGVYQMPACEQAQRNESEKGELVTQDVRWFDAFMVVAVNVTATHNYLEFNDFVNIFTQWNSDAENCSVQLSEEVIKENVKAATVAMVRDGWVGQPEEAIIEIPDPSNMSKKIKVKRYIRPTTDKFNELYASTYSEMQDTIPMKCQPLRFAPEPWKFDDDGKVVGIHERALLRFNKGKSVPSQMTLDAINKDMMQPLKAHPAMIKLARLAVSNGQVFRELDKQDPAEWEGAVRTWDAMRKLTPNTDYYFPITLDHRSREYYRGGSITPQGGNACKACFIDAAEPELGMSGMQAMYVAFATSVGIKGSIKSRLLWTQSKLHEGKLKEWLDMSPIKFLTMFKDEDKYQAYVILSEIMTAYKWAAENNLPVSQFRSGVILHQDGICNGMQHMGVITRNRQTCVATNVIPMTHNDDLNDAYGLVVQNTEHLKQFGRDIGKVGTMVSGYGASDATVKRSVRDKMGYEAYHEMHGQDLVQAIKTTLPAIETVTSAIKMACEDILNNGETEIVMYAKDGFKQVQQYKYNTDAILPLGSFATVKFTEEPDTLNCEQMITATSPNMIHMNDGCHVRFVVLESQWKVVTVHDSYGTAPANYFATNKILAETLADNYTDYCPVANLHEDYHLNWGGFIVMDDAITLDDVRLAYNAFS